MKSKRLAIFTLSLLISNVCLAQEVSEPVAHQYKSYHGDGIDNVLEYVPTAAVFGLKLLGVPAESSWKRRLTVSVVSFGINAAVTYSLKHTIHEMRPDGTDNHSFPSGHTFSSVAAAIGIWHWNRKWGIAAVVTAILMMFSRLYFYVHYPTDILGGILLGTVLALLSIQIVEKTLASERWKNWRNKRRDER